MTDEEFDAMNNRLLDMKAEAEKWLAEERARLTPAQRIAFDIQRRAYEAVTHCMIYGHATSRIWLDEETMEIKQELTP